MKTAGVILGNAATRQCDVIARESRVQAMLRYLENGNRPTAMLALPYGA